MSKKRKVKTKARRRIAREVCGENRHHVLFQGRHWNTGCAKLLRDNFIFLMPVCVHNDLHNLVIHDIPVPDDVAKIWRVYQAEQPELDDVVIACDWLISNSDDEAFVACMRRQRDFFAQNLR